MSILLFISLFVHLFVVCLFINLFFDACIIGQAQISVWTALVAFCDLKDLRCHSGGLKLKAKKDVQHDPS